MNCIFRPEDFIGRGEDICRLIRPLVGKGRVAFDRFTSREAIVFGAYSGKRPENPIDEWRFTTSVARIRGAYRERWTPVDGGKLYRLDLGYLHLYERQPGGQSERQFIALHCDPNEPDDAPHAKYKQGPHIHIVTAPQPLPHSHLALNVQDLAGVLSSVRTLQGAFAAAIELLRDEVLSHYPKNHA